MTDLAKSQAAPTPWPLTTTLPPTLTTAPAKSQAVPTSWPPTTTLPPTPTMAPANMGMEIAALAIQRVPLGPAAAALALLVVQQEVLARTLTTVLQIAAHMATAMAATSPVALLTLTKMATSIASSPMPWALAKPVTQPLLSRNIPKAVT